MSTLSVMVGTPCFAGMTYSAHLRSCITLVDWFARNHIQYQWTHVDNESLISRARNLIAHRFLESSCTHLLMIDGDIGFQVQDVIDLMFADTDMAYGTYAQKVINWQNVIDGLGRGATAENLSLYSGQFVDKAMTGFALIRRAAFEKMRKVYKKDYTYNGVKMHAYFDTEIIDDEYLSEDYLFCHRLTQIGCNIRFVENIHLTHMGTYAFNGDYRA